MIEDLKMLTRRLTEVLSQEKGYFGRISTWGQRPTEYEYIGYELSDDFLPTLETMTKDQQTNLMKIMNYFEIHAIPLKKLLEVKEKNSLDQFYSDICWSQFMTVIMFGMLEIAIKGKDTKRLNYKLKNIKKFLESNLSENRKNDVFKRYKIEKVFKYEKEVKNFSDIVDHLWDKIRSGFIHDGGIETKGMEWHTLEGMGTKENPIRVKSDVPMQEWLQITWEAILSSYGYNGKLVLPKYK